jgi:hypothetical protein
MGNRHNAASHPDWRAITSFFLRSKGLQIRRSATNALRRAPVLLSGKVEDFPLVLAESVSPLHTASDPRERPLMLGKIQNLRLACIRIHRRVLPAGAVFSLWRQIGPPWRSRGFVRGREVREGCVIPTFGGGLCQLSGSLLEVALGLELELLERHRHTSQPADVPGDLRRDATLFWNYVDLRFRSPVPLLIESFLTDAHLVVRLRGMRPREATVQIAGGNDARTAPRPQDLLQSCFTCGKTECARHVTSTPAAGKTAFLMDEYQPEFAELFRHHRKDGDQLLLPFVSQKGWSLTRTGGNGDVLSPPWFRYRRSLTLRWAVFRGITVAKAYFELAGELASFCARRLAYDTEHICVAQSLVPYLWRSGVLAGRTFDVLAQRLPVVELERQLDTAAQLYPQSKTLAEFRAPRWFVDAEQEALQAARTVFTPHAQLAALFERSTRLPWQAASRQNGHQSRKDLLVFVGPTLARKGAYAVREAVKQTGFTLAVAGADLEDPGFWGDLPLLRLNLRELPWERIHTAVQPALIEYWPRQLLRAHAAGANLVITPMCGLEEDHAAGIHHVPFGDADALAAILTALLSTPKPVSTQGASPCEQ